MFVAMVPWRLHYSALAHLDERCFPWEFITNAQFMISLSSYAPAPKTKHAAQNLMFFHRLLDERIVLELIHATIQPNCVCRVSVGIPVPRLFIPFVSIQSFGSLAFPIWVTGSQLGNARSLL